MDEKDAMGALIDLAMFLGAQIEKDNDGQIIIYTGIVEND